VDVVTTKIGGQSVRRTSVNKREAVVPSRSVRTIGMAKGRSLLVEVLGADIVTTRTAVFEPDKVN
jgi:hypothetical protein